MKQIQKILAPVVLASVLIAGCSVPRNETLTFYEPDATRDKLFNTGCSYGGAKTGVNRSLPGKIEMQWSGIYWKPKSGDTVSDMTTHVIITGPVSETFKFNPKRFVAVVDGRRVRPTKADYSVKKNSKSAGHFIDLTYRLPAQKTYQKMGVEFEKGAATLNGRAYPLAPFRAQLVTKSVTTSDMWNC